VSAIAYSSARMLDVLGGWKKLKQNAEPIRDILVTDGKIGEPPSPFSLHFDHREIGEAMGYIAENRHIRAALLDCAAALQTLDIANPEQLTGFERCDGSVDVQLESGRRVSPLLLVAAEGRSEEHTSELQSPDHL